MPTIFSHAILPLAAGLGLGKARVSRPLLAAGMLAAMLPDADVLAFRLGIPYAHALGHRGFSHSLLAAAVVGLLAMLASRRLHSTRLAAFTFTFLSMASHGLLDMLTNGGKGVALLWPWSFERLFFPWHGIEVSPIGMQRFLSARGLAVIASELLWIWLPCLIGALLLHRKRARQR